MKHRTLAALALLAAAPLAARVAPLGQGGQGGQGPATLSPPELGRVLDREGAATRRRPLDDRPEPALPGLELGLGDWLDVASRGANALRARLRSAELVLGPGTLVELGAPDAVALARGELLVEPRDGARLRVLGPGGAALEVAERAVLRARAGALQRLDEDPAWLRGYLADASTEALGSLLANVDGRNVPLTIGYHKVTVDVRDQLARTVVEESFENHTSSILEGVFYFPLPADASVSGFGMWIGEELVQGEIVEKERARAIYETILSERRDPGLLEWTGGNLFKARVFPIGAEKRIRIAYTQVLEKRGDAYSYRYGLDSELLRQTPLRRLDVSVRISSEEPLADVACPTHACRVRRTEHAAQVDFSAEEFAPEGDLEVVVRTAPAASPVRLVQHVRARDGYFAVLLDAPPVDAELARETAREPLDLLVLLDTSASSAGRPRDAELAFLDALLGALSPRDRFDVATLDVETRWAFGRTQVATPQRREEALAFVEAREPLGWTDLPAAFAQAFQRASETTRIVYVGDAVPTSGSTDPAEVARAIGRARRGRASVHAVVPGSSFEPLLVDALSRLGDGSAREITGERGPAETAWELVRELTSPALTDVRVDFGDLPVAAVHPERLPNLASGSQHVVVGRFDPGAAPRAGVVRVTGRLAGREVAYERPVALLPRQPEDGEGAGNSFLPRLWARGHVDWLLAQGASRELRERVVALSEAFQIATPYSSFLVLESDADRERFGVERRFRMRDGEEFFAEGRDRARHALVREEMRAAATWRAGLREGVLRSLDDMGRELTALLRGPRPADYGELRALGYAGAAAAPASPEEGFETNELAFREGEASDEATDLEEAETDDLEPLAAEPALEEALPASAPPARQERMAKSVAADADGFLLGGVGRRRAHLGSRRDYQAPDPFEALLPSLAGPRGPGDPESFPEDVRALLARLDRRAALAASPSPWRIAVETAATDARGRERRSSASLVAGAGAWISRAAHAPGHAYAVDWLLGDERGVVTEGWRLGRSRPPEPGDAAAFAAPFPWYFGDELAARGEREVALEPLEDGRARLTLRTPGAEGTGGTGSALELLVDVQRSCVLAADWIVRGERRTGVAFEELFEAGGLWWPGRVRWWTAEGESSTVARVRVERAEGAAPEALVRAELAPLAGALVLPPPRADRDALADAKRAARAGDAGVAERWRLLGHEARSQRFDRARPHLDALAELLPGSPAVARVRLAFLLQSRRHAELLDELAALAADLAAAPREAELALAMDLVWTAQAAAERGDETLALLDAVEPVLARGGRDALLTLAQRRLDALAATSRAEEHFRAYAEAVRAWPDVLALRQGFAQLLAARGEVDAALDELASAAGAGPWSRWELQQLRRARIEVLRGAYRLDEVARELAAWDAAEPDALDASLHGERLSALVLLDRADEARALVDAWCARAGLPEPGPGDEARLQAAIAHLRGQGVGYWARRLGEDAAERLAALARTLLDLERDSTAHGSVLSDWRFQRSDAGRALARELGDALAAGAGTLPAARVVRLLDALRWFRGVVTEEERAADEAIQRTLLARWSAERDPHGRDARSPERALLERALRGSATGAVRLAFLRAVLAEAATADARFAAARELRGALQGEPWSPEVQRELAGLLALAPEVSDEAAAAERALALSELVDWILAARVEATVRGRADYDTLTRRQLASARRDALREARAGAAELAAELAQSLAPAALADWARIERLWLAVKAGAAPDDAFERALALLAPRVPRIAAAEAERTPDAVPLLERVLAERAVRTALRLLLPLEGERLAAREAALTAELQRLAETRSGLPDGRASLRDLLLALDRPAELERELARWYGDGSDFAAQRHGVELARLAAERGDLERAAELALSVERADEVTPDLLLSLAGWCTALDRPADARAAEQRAFEAMDVQRLTAELWAEINAQSRWGDGPPPELDPRTLPRLRALLAKSPHPVDAVELAGHLWRRTKDFRVLEGLPETVLGATPRAIYPLLEALGTVLESLDEEAAVDRVDARLDELARSAATDADRRALALLAFHVSRSAARQRDGGEPHAERALAALRAALRGEWARGEAVQMAQVLASRGALPGALGEEQLAALRRLEDAPTDPDEVFAVRVLRANALWQHGRRDEAARVLEGALAALRGGAGRSLPERADGALGTLAGWRVERGEWRAAEALWRAELAAGPTPARALRLRASLLELEVLAVQRDAELAAGRGPALYAAVLAELRAELARRTNEDHAARVGGLLFDLLTRAGSQQEVARARDDAIEVAYGDLPRALALYQHRGCRNLVSAAVECVRVLAGPRAGLELLLARAEAEPAWLAVAGQDAWAGHAWLLGRLIAQAGELDPVLERRALALALRELRLDLETREQRSRDVYSARGSHFWAAQRPAFRAAALDVLQARARVPESVAWIAQYLFRDLDAKDDAVEALAASLARGELRYEGRDLLAGFLMELGRWGEAVPVLEGLVADRPAEAGHRAQLVRALARSAGSEAAARSLAASEAALRERSAFGEGPAAALADACVDAQLFGDAARLIEIAIAEHVRTAPDRGVGGGQLSWYYQRLASARSGLGDTAGAVDAAAGAVVSWGRHVDQRAQALASLVEVLRSAPDLAAYAARLDDEVRRTGLENPVVRRALAQAFLLRGEPARAARELELAVLQRPDDLEARRLLVEALERAGRPDRAADAAVELARAGGHGLAAWVEAAGRLRALEDPRAERALTTLVELSANESEGHALLAKAREQDGRYEEALAQWRHVVRVREREPEGHLGAMRALLRLGRRDEARAELDRVRATEWPERFGDVRGQAERLWRELGSN